MGVDIGRDRWKSESQLVDISLHHHIISYHISYHYIIILFRTGYSYCSVLKSLSSGMLSDAADDNRLLRR